MNHKECKVTTEEIEAGINDGLGGIYSQDGKRLLMYTDNSKENYTVKDGTEVICDGAFATCQPTYKLRQISLPDSLLAIGENAFEWHAKLSKINLPPNLKYIGDNAFDGCKSLRKITLPPSLSILCVKVFSGTRSNLKMISDSPCFKVENGSLLTSDGSRLLFFENRYRAIHYSTFG